MIRLRRRDAIMAGLAALARPRRPRAAPAPAFPLRASPDGHFLVDARGQPFFIQGDSPQAIYARLSPAEIDAYLDLRQAQGFNTLLADPAFSNNNDGHVRPAPDGRLPFLRNAYGGRYDGARGSADFSTPDPAYWDHVDAVTARAGARGFLVLQYALSWGYDGKTMWRDLTNGCNTEAACHGFGAFLGRRFRDRANIVWIDGSDYNGDATPRAPDGTSGIARAPAITRGMRAAGATQLRTGDWQADSLATDQRAFAPYMTVNGVYTYGTKENFETTYHEPRRAWRHTPPLPAFLKETWYEGEHAFMGEPTQVRQHEWWALLSGATAGVVYGHADVWPFAAGSWRAALTSPGAADMQRMGALMRSVAWQALVPSGLGGMHRLVLSENGQAQPPRADYVAASATPDGRLLLAYLPPAGDGPQRLTLDLRGMAAPAQARWWDPTAATTQPAAAVQPDTTPTLASPSRNRGGANDWVLVVEAAA